MKITQDVKNEVIEIIEKYNKNKSRKYFPRFHTTNGLLFLDRRDEENITKICRLKFKGKMDNWDFAIYKYSTGTYSPDEFYFPGDDYVDGTIEGAMKAGDKAYY